MKVQSIASNEHSWLALFAKYEINIDFKRFLELDKRRVISWLPSYDTIELKERKRVGCLVEGPSSPQILGGHLFLRWKTSLEIILRMP